jgi:mannose-6-phosphate isomerase-like protein (cupin superfamily)
MDILSREILKDVALDEGTPKPRRERSPVDHWPTPVLLERAAYLRKMARAGDGSASETLREYPQHTAMLSVRLRSGELETYENFAVIFHVLAGNATLLTGVRAARARPNQAALAPGNHAEEGTRHELRAGDVVHVPAGTPHQFLIAGEKSIACLAIKLHEPM